MKDIAVISPNGEKSILGKDIVSGESRAISVNPDGSFVSGGSSVGGSQSIYSNDAGDFTATPTVAARLIVLSAFATTQLSDMLALVGPVMFAKATIFKIDSAGKKTSLPITTIAWDNGTLTLTLADMNAPFATGDVVNVSIPGPVKWYDLGAGEDVVNDLQKVEQRFNYQNIVLAAPTTTTVKVGSGLLHSITINTPVASSVITIYDNTAASGTKIATITLPATLLQQGPYTALLDVAFGSGLTIVTATGASDITVAYR